MRTYGRADGRRVRHGKSNNTKKYCAELGKRSADTLPSKVKVKVKCPLVQALRLCTGHTANRGLEVYV